MYRIGITESILENGTREYEDCHFERARIERKYDALLIGLDTILTKENWEKYGSPYILSPTTNISYIPRELWSYVIKVDPKEIEHISATAEHALCLFLMGCRRMRNKIMAPRETWLGRQVAGMNVAIFGYGRIGKLLDSYCQALKMNVKTFDKKDNEDAKIKLFNWADVIFVCLTYDDTTHDFFNESYIDDFKKGQIVVNTSRAQIINKEFMFRCIDEKIWDYVCMDFINYEDKPYYLDPDFSRRSDRLILTPHIAGNTKDSLQIVINNVVDKFLEMKNNE